MRTLPKICSLLAITICLASCVSMVKYRGLEQSVNQLQSRPQYDPTDSDGDGVPDMTDYEKNSPPGARVDTRGIVLDSDLDGVPDYKDREPYSAPGARIDQNGVTARTDANGRPISNPGTTNPVDDRPGTGYNPPPTTPAAPQYLSTVINFGIYSTLVGVEEQRKLDDLAASLSQTPGARLEVLGFADDYRISNDNIRLALQRAEAVKQALVDRGIPPTSLTTSTAVPTREDAGKYMVRFKMSSGGSVSNPSGQTNAPVGDEASPIFPTPYPQPSSMALLAANMLPKGNSLFDISSQMTDALRRAGYDRIWYFNLPAGYNGFALITQIESINDDATPAAPRFEQAVNANMTSLGELEKYFFNLIKARRGLFRYTVLLVSDRSTGPDTGFDDPSNVMRDPTPGTGGGAYNLQALVYEFYKEQYNSNPVFTKERQPAALHIERSGIAAQLRKAAAASGSFTNPPAPGAGNPNVPDSQPGTVSGKYYTVQKGDTVYSLSKRFRLTETQLRKMNGMSDNAIQIGQRLKIAE